MLRHATVIIKCPLPRTALVKVTSLDHVTHSNGFFFLCAVVSVLLFLFVILLQRGK